ncbi:MAG: transglycosylase SLT domain-containing protein [Deltaproteobacteria bacterium]|nr:transglycosylase SLT domain-containing protein [Deltaproteobacteria bacterium]
MMWNRNRGWTVRLLLLLLIGFALPFPDGPLSAREKGTEQTGREALSRIRKTFVSGVMALKNGNSLIARLELDKLDGVDYILDDYLLYYRIRAENESGDPATALRHEEQFLKEYPESLLLERVRIEEIKSLIASGRFGPAASALRKLQSMKLSGELARKIALLAGEVAAGREDWAKAYDLYLHLAFQSPATEEGKEADRRRESIAGRLKSPPKSPDAKLYLTRIRELFRALKFPGVIENCHEMVKLYPKGIPTDQALLLKGRAWIKEGDLPEGRKLLKRVAREAGAASIRSEALYWLGNSFWNKNEDRSARHLFQRLLKHYPKSKWTVRALYAMGRIYEAGRNISKAREYYLRIGKKTPQNDLASKGAWRIGWMEYRAGKYRKAEAAFDFCMDRYPDSKINAGALYWKGRCRERLKEIEKARAIYRRLAKEFGWDFYGVMARKRLTYSWNLVADSPESDDPDCDRTPPAAAEGTPLADYRDHAEELIRIGFSDAAREEIRAVADLLEKKDKNLCYVGDLYERSGNFYDAVRWMYRVSTNHYSAVNGGDSPFFKRYLYPRAFWETVRRESGRYGIDPFLVLAVMRQESLYQVDSISLSDARGLMQIIPPTGELIARDLGVETFTPESLLDPETNIAFGVRYLNNLIQRSGGDLVRVFSSYNAGERPSDRWWEKTKDLDVDERIESIPFRETRGYVKRVLRNLENYKRLYRDE